MRRVRGSEPGAQKLVRVGLGDVRWSTEVDSNLITYAVGSCIVVTAFDAQAKVGGMIHYMLPVASFAPERVAAKPAMFADVGVPMLFDGMYERGAKKAQLVVKVAGGARLNDPDGVFDVGRRNYEVLLRMFEKVAISIHAKSVGGTDSRTVELCMTSGALFVRTPTEEFQL